MARVNLAVVVISIAIGFVLRGVTDVLRFDVDKLVEKIDQKLNHRRSIAESFSIQPKFVPKNEYQVKRWELLKDGSVYDTDVLGISEPRIDISGEYKEELHDLEQELQIKIRTLYRRNDKRRGTEFLLDTYGGERYEVTKPLSPKFQVTYRKITDKSIKVRIICPVSNVGDRLKLFVENFIHQNLQYVDLLLVHMQGKGNEQDHTVKDLTQKYEGKIKVMEIADDFSRGLALTKGTEKFNENDLILFLDVDMDFTSEIINQCRSNAKQDKRVWFPIVWSQYDPEVIAKGAPPGQKDVVLSKITKWTGYWVHYGYGMLCAYKSDFIKVGGFPDIKGWGGEDVAIFKNFVADHEIEVLHSVEPDLVHRFHKKNCDKNALSHEQYRMCMGAQADTIGNKQQLAMLYLLGRQ